MKGVSQAFKAIMAKKASFISRGDRSGTNMAELRILKSAAVDINKDNNPLVQGDRSGNGRRAQHRQHR